MLLHHDSKKNSTGTSLIYGSGALHKSYDAYVQFLSLLKQTIHHWIYSQLSVAPHVLKKKDKIEQSFSLSSLRMYVYRLLQEEGISYYLRIMAFSSVIQNFHCCFN